MRQKINIIQMFITTTTLFSTLLASSFAYDEYDNGFNHFEKRAAMTVGGGWHSFSFGREGSVAGPFLFSSETCTEVRITDAFCYGDHFEVRDHDVSLGNTSFPGRTTCSGGVYNADSAFSDSDMSSGSFILEAGEHSVDMVVMLSPFGGGGAYIRVDEVECPFTCDGKPNGYQECAEEGYYHECSWGEHHTREVAPGTECCNWSAAQRVLLVAEGSACPF